MADDSKHSSDFAAAAMKSMFDNADVSIKREDGTQVVTQGESTPPARVTTDGRRETAGSFDVEDPQLAVTPRDAGVSPATLTVGVLGLAALAALAYTLL